MNPPQASHTSDYVLIVNYHSTKYVRRVLNTLPEDVRVVIVDNFSTKEERSRVLDLQSDRVLVLPNENNGFAGGVNVGNRAIDPSCSVVLVNPDVEFLPGAYHHLISKSRENNLDIASPCILQNYEGEIWYCGGRIRASDLMVVHTNMGEIMPMCDALKETEFISGCVVYLSAAARKSLLPLDESMFMYYEDVLMSLDAKRSGIKMHLVTGSRVIHSEGATSRSNVTRRSALYHYYQARNRYLVSRRIGWNYYLRALLTLPLVLAVQIGRIIKNEGFSVNNLLAAILGNFDGILLRDGVSHRHIA